MNDNVMKTLNLILERQNMIFDLLGVQPGETEEKHGHPHTSNSDKLQTVRYTNGVAETVDFCSTTPFKPERPCSPKMIGAGGNPTPHNLLMGAIVATSNSRDKFDWYTVPAFFSLPFDSDRKLPFSKIITQGFPSDIARVLNSEPENGTIGYMVELNVVMRDCYSNALNFKLTQPEQYAQLVGHWSSIRSNQETITYPTTKEQAIMMNEVPIELFTRYMDSNGLEKPCYAGGMNHVEAKNYGFEVTYPIGLQDPTSK